MSTIVKTKGTRLVRWLSRQRFGPIGVDLGSRSVKLLQLGSDRTRPIDAVRWDLPPADAGQALEQRAQQWSDAIRQALEGRRFRGREAVLCLGARELFVQNIRVPKLPSIELETTVRQEAAARLPFAADEAELRFIDAADVRQGDLTRREVVLLACHRPVLESLLKSVIDAGLRPAAVDVEPISLLRCYVRQFRRDEDRQQRAMYVHVGATNTAVIIAQGGEVLFVKYVGVGGRQMDEAVAQYLSMSQNDAEALRRHNGDRRTDQQDPDVSRSVAEAIRPVFDRLASELSLCVRYHSVTFRGQPLSRLVLGGGEATSVLAEALAARLDMKCELGDPLRGSDVNLPGRKGQWDVVTGLALRQLG